MSRSNSRKMLPRHFSCGKCGQVYESAMVCICPVCRAGVIHQFPMTHEEIHNKRSYIHQAKPTAYASKVLQNNPEYLFESDVNAVEQYQNSCVLVDYLSFTVKLSDFRHCSKAGDFSGFAFPAPPVCPSIKAKTQQDLIDVQEFNRRLYLDYLEDVLKVFINRVLGFSCGAMRGKGFQFYDDSFALFADTVNDSGVETSSVYCGQVGLGGNRDTVHFQIPASGCKYLFTNRSRQFVHHWLANVLNVTLLTRLDLALDDFDNLHTCEAAERAFLVGGFKRSRGFSPMFSNGDKFTITDSGEKVYSMEARFIGSRQSLVYWRIYNKKLERNIDKEDFHWYRSEVELKKVSVDVLLDIEGYFVGLCEYAASLPSKTITPSQLVTIAKKRVACDVLSAAHWCKRQYGRLVQSLFDLYNGDTERVVGTLIRTDTNIGFTSMHHQLINVLE